MAQMNERRRPQPQRPVDHLARQVDLEVAAETAKRLAETAKRLAETAKRLADAERAARDARVREEERKALLAKVAKMPAAERVKYLEEERIVAKGREWGTRLRKQEIVVDFGLFGIYD